MKISINGEEAVIQGSVTIAGLLAKRKINPAAVVVEHNGAIINCREWEKILVEEKDTLEIVSFVGGG